MKILFDTNVVLDFLLEREPHFNSANTLMKLVERKKMEGYLCANSVTTIDYLVAKHLNRTASRLTVQRLLKIFQVATVDQRILNIAVDSLFEDFEDAVLYQSGKNAGVDAIVTRNNRDFKHALLPVYSPDELLEILHI